MDMLKEDRNWELEEFLLKQCNKLGILVLLLLESMYQVVTDAARNSGLKVGDVIVNFDGTEIKSLTDLRTAHVIIQLVIQ